MTIAERKERNREELRQLILNAAEEIMGKEGIEKLSIRKIASRIEYSPAIIYHYFRDKSAIIEQITGNRFQMILSAISKNKQTASDPLERFKEVNRTYIETALSMSDSYLSAQLSTSSEVLEFTSCMFQGAGRSNPALAILCSSIEALYPGSPPAEEELELTAQMIVSASIGLILKLTVEKDLPEEQRKRLIDQFVNVTVLKIAGRSSL